MHVRALVLCVCIVGSVVIADAALVTLTKDVDGSLSLDTDAWEELLSKAEVKSMPLVIVAIAGAARTGKSFLMNFLLRYLKEEGWENPDWFGGDDKMADEGFVWSGGEEPTTIGIQAWNEFFILTTKNWGKVAVLLIDTQGLFDQHTTKENNVRLFAFSSLASSVQLLNVRDRIEERDLENLHFCVSMASASTDGEDFRLQTLVLPVQNWPNVHQTPYGLDGGRRYIRRVLSTKGRAKELNEVRNQLEATYSDVIGYLMPHPGLIVTDFRKFTGANRELSEEYKVHVKMFVENLLHPDNLVPKKWHGKLMKWNQLLNLLKASNEAFGDGRVPKPESIVTVNAKLHYANQFDNSVLVYNESMQRHLEKRKYIAEGDLRDLYLQCKSEALSLFDSSKNLGNAEIRTAYRSSLVERLDDEFKSYQAIMRLRKEAIEKKLRKSVATCLRRYTENVDKNIGATSLPESTLKSLHEKQSSHALSEFRRTASSPSTFLQQFEAELQTGIDDHFKKVKRANDYKLEEEERQRKIQQEMKREHQREQERLRREKEEEARRDGDGGLFGVKVRWGRIRFEL